MHSGSEAQLSKALGKLSKTSIKIPTNKTAGRGLVPSYPLLLLHRIQVIHLRRATFEFVYFSMLFLFACLFLTRSRARSQAEVLFLHLPQRFLGSLTPKPVAGRTAVEIHTQPTLQPQDG